MFNTGVFLSVSGRRTVLNWFCCVHRWMRVQWWRKLEWRQKGVQSLCTRSPSRSWHPAASSPSGSTHTNVTRDCVLWSLFRLAFLFSLLVRVSLDPKAQKLVGLLRYYLSQFSPKYRRGSVADENPPDALKKPLAQWAHHILNTGLFVVWMKWDWQNVSR